MIEGLEAAVRAGVIDRATAQRLEPYLAGGGTPADTADPDDERLRLVTGFNDIFVTIGLGLFLSALGYLLKDDNVTLAAVAVAAAAWVLAEFFTRVKRMALPSIVLLVVFVGAVYLAAASLVSPASGITPSQMIPAALAAAGAALIHWTRFHVPITVAAGVAALALILYALCIMLAPDLMASHPFIVFLPVGLGIFALAMRFDMSDLKRQTRRTDIAFWLHLLAAPLIVHPILVTMMAGQPSTLTAALIVLAFLFLAVVALIVDRRAILVSSLIYLAYAAGTLIAAAGIESASSTMATLAVGAVVLTLSAAWRPLRRALVGMLSIAVRQRLPAVN